MVSFGIDEKNKATAIMKFHKDFETTANLFMRDLRYYVNLVERTDGNKALDEEVEKKMDEFKKEISEETVFIRYVLDCVESICELKNDIRTAELKQTHEIQQQINFLKSTLKAYGDCEKKVKNDEAYHEY